MSALAAPPAGRVSWARAAPQIDGRPDDPSWANATPIGPLTERKPHLRARPPVTTTTRMLVDHAALYVLVECSDPAPVRALTRQRDTFAIFRDDAVSLKFNPDLDGRTTLGFAINPAGARMDYRGLNESEFRPEYDAVWQAAATVTPTGWVAEFRIPLVVLGIDPSHPPSAIGFNLSRDHPRRNATYDWALMPPPYSPISASRYGRIQGLSVLADHPQAAMPPLSAAGEERLGARAWIIPHLTGGFTRLRGDPARGTFNFGADATAHVGATTRAQLTVNTDFAQADLDDQVVNLDRFGLFLPEKRDFFLQDLEVFSFGRARSSQLLHTRRIGLRDGAAISLAGGLKVVSQPTGGLRLGLLQITSRPSGESPWTSSAVGRATVEMGGGSNVGLMLTHRQNLERAADYNLAVGVDGVWRGPPRLPFLLEGFGLLSLTGEGASAAETATGAAEDRRGEAAPGAMLALSWRGELVRPALRLEWFSAGLRTDLGFFRRVDVQTATGSLTVEPRIGRHGLEKLTLTAQASALGDAGFDALLDWTGALTARLVWDAGWNVALQGAWRQETVSDAFAVGHETWIPEGQYGGGDLRLTLGSPSTGVASGGLGLDWRHYFGGRLWGLDGSLSLQPAALVRVDLGARWDHTGGFDAGRPGFESVTANGRLTLSPTRSALFSVYAGWSLLDDALQMQARARYTFHPGSDLFLVYQVNMIQRASTLRGQSLLLKVAARY